MRRAVVAALALLAVPGASFAIEVREAHWVMGTILELTVDAPDRAAGRKQIRSAVAEARRLDRELTSFSRESALSRLNEAAGTPAAVPEDLFAIVARSRVLSEATGGIFDVSVGPLVGLWKRAAERDEWPAAEEIAGARSLVGHERIGLVPPDTIVLAPGMSLELGGIGKGWAVDRMVALLRGAGVERAFVSFGESSIRAFSPAGAAAWPVWIRRPERPGSLEGPLFLEDAALSTSRSLGRSKRIGGRRVGHVLDPRSGLALSQDRQATIVAPNATDAEAWSKAALVDPERTLTTLERKDGHGALVVAGHAERRTISFAALTRPRGVR